MKSDEPTMDVNEFGFTMEPFSIDEEVFEEESSDDEDFYHDNDIFCFSTPGRKKKNQDQFDFVKNSHFVLLGLYDGHGGCAVSLYLKNSLLNKIIRHEEIFTNPLNSILKSIQQIEEQVKNNFDPNCGSAVAVVFIDKERMIVVNVGDVACFGIKQKQSADRVQLSIDHTLNDEVERDMVRNKGGLLFKRGGGYRIGGVLNLSRSIGDSYFKPQISAQPSVKILKQSQNFTHIVVVSDGFLNIFNSLQKYDQNLITNLMKQKNKLKDNATIICLNNPFTHL